MSFMARFALLVVVFCLLGGSGCRSCLSMGCDSTVMVQFDSVSSPREGANSAYTICFDGDCFAAPSEPETVSFRLSLFDYREGQAIEVVLRDGSDAELSNIEAVGKLNSPNGEACGPNCVYLEVLVGPKGSLAAR